jgi:6-methylsalicylate decarboxylase
MTRIDLHQHLWTVPLLRALEARTLAPLVRRSQDGWLLELAGEPPSLVVADDVAARSRLVAQDGVDRALVSLSTALGVETLPEPEGRVLLDAYAEGVEALPARLGSWAAISLSADPAHEAQRLARTLPAHAGLCLPAAALATPTAVARLSPLLEVLEDAGAPLFVHPGPARAPADAPSWWPALADYVAQLQAAWLAVAVDARPALPRLRVVFAALAGLAPLHHERLSARGGSDAALDDPGLFYDTSSYGVSALQAMVDAVGVSQLVHGSDRPVVGPPAPPGPLGAGAWEALTVDNPTRLFAPVPAHR